MLSINVSNTDCNHRIVEKYVSGSFKVLIYKINRFFIFPDPSTAPVCELVHFSSLLTPVVHAIDAEESI